MWFTELSGQRERKHGLITTCSNGQFYDVPKQHGSWQQVAICVVGNWTSPVSAIGHQGPWDFYTHGCARCDRDICSLIEDFQIMVKDPPQFRDAHFGPLSSHIHQAGTQAEYCSILDWNGQSAHISPGGFIGTMPWEREELGPEGLGASVLMSSAENPIAMALQQALGAGRECSI